MVPAATVDMLNPQNRVDLPLNIARQAMYRFASLALLDPRLGSWSRLRELRNDPLLAESADFLRNLPNASSKTLARGERPLDLLDTESVLRLLPEAEHELNDSYEAVFGLLVSSNCPPYETEYINSKFAFQRSNSLADVSGYYHAFGLKPADEHPERADHVAIELEFMACLLGLERAAADCMSVGCEERLDVCRAAQKNFLERHLAWWAPTFAMLVEKADNGGYYAAAAAFLAAFMAAERSILGVSPAFKMTEPSVVEGPDMCDGCGLAN